MQLLNWHQMLAVDAYHSTKEAKYTHCIFCFFCAMIKMKGGKGYGSVFA